VDAARQIKSAAKRVRLIQGLLFGLSSDTFWNVDYPILRQVSDELPEALRSTIDHYILYIGNLGIKDDWLTSELDRIGRNWTGSWAKLETGYISRAFNNQPDRRGLLPVLILRTQFLGMSDADIASQISSLDVSAFAERVNDEDSVRIAVALVRLISGKWDKVDNPKLVESMTTLNGISLEFPLEQFLRRCGRTHQNRSELITTIVARCMELKHPRLFSFREVLSLDQDTKLSILVEESRRAQLELPTVP
jgi:hypothetical protein